MFVLPEPALCLITDERLATADIEARVAAACDAGCRLVQLRNRCLAEPALGDHAARLRTITAERGALLVINAHHEIAVRVGADAVHLPAADGSATAVRAALGRHAGLGRSVHSEQEVGLFAVEHPDYFHFGPIYRTDSKARYGPPQGRVRLRRLAQRVKLLDGPPKLIAVGGIEKKNVAATMESGVDGVAVIGAVMRAPDAGAATAALLKALREAPSR